MSKVGDGAFNWAAQGNTFNTWCHYTQEDVPEPGHTCPVYLRALGYEQVRNTDTCVSFFAGRVPARSEHDLDELPQPPVVVEAVARPAGAPPPGVVSYPRSVFEEQLCGVTKVFKDAPDTMYTCNVALDMQPDTRRHRGYHSEIDRSGNGASWKNRVVRRVPEN